MSPLCHQRSRTGSRRQLVKILPREEGECVLRPVNLLQKTRKAAGRRGPNTPGPAERQRGRQPARAPRTRSANPAAFLHSGHLCTSARPPPVRGHRGRGAAGTRQGRQAGRPRRPAPPLLTKRGGGLAEVDRGAGLLKRITKRPANPPAAEHPHMTHLARRRGGERGASSCLESGNQSAAQRPVDRRESMSSGDGTG